MNLEMPAMVSFPHGLGSPSYHPSRGGACELTAGSQGMAGRRQVIVPVIEHTVVRPGWPPKNDKLCVRLARNTYLSVSCHYVGVGGSVVRLYHLGWREVLDGGQATEALLATALEPQEIEQGVQSGQRSRTWVLHIRLAIANRNFTVNSANSFVQQ
jgi:hypothetical protein